MGLVWWYLLLLGAAAFLLQEGFCGFSHSLKIFHMGLSELTQKLPQCVFAAYVDDQPIAYYDSNTMKNASALAWMQKYWDLDTQNIDQICKMRLTYLKNYSQSSGIHTWQRMFGCDLNENGYRGGYYQCAYGGRDFLSFDKKTLTWTAIVPWAQMTKRRWEADPAIAHYWKGYLEKMCIEGLQKYLEYGRETLMRTEPPVVKVTRTSGHGGLETLICQAHGFYPKEIDATWVKDGEVWEHETFRRGVTPNSDGTYHTWLSIQIDPKERDRYRCHVEHDSLLRPLDLAWEEPALVPTGLIVGAILGVLVAILLVTGIIFYVRKEKGDGYKAPSTPSSLEMATEHHQLALLWKCYSNFNKQSLKMCEKRAEEIHPGLTEIHPKNSYQP
ncbi:major histocompatibility complex class I-related gene protein-like [Hemicordylus capensis]|uniref:major histocompatibility complex class I-related gene protein-like n=1 Tax=Hemicordylus capensis TaxID=884348 RepID=UPI00230269C6|nr:major histocompatibility complex class I-related gene protein-like [Hemicordylus capensis]